MNAPDRKRIVFMGSPEIAVPSLEAAAGEFDVRLVVTQPDRPKGRGRKVRPTAVHARAEALGLPVLAAENVNAAEVVGRIAQARPDAIVVVSFGQLLKARILDIAPLGCVNVHFSLLPELRGAAPVAWAIIRCMEETGVSVMRMAPRMDAGPVYAQVTERVREDDTTATLSARLAATGAKALVETLPRIFDGTAVAEPQDDAKGTYAPKITREMGSVDWTASAREVDCLIRGLSGQSEAYSFFEDGRRLRVTFYLSAVAAGADGLAPGQIARGRAGELVVGCGEGAVEIREIQAEGRKRVSGREFANGYHVKGGERFISCSAKS